MMSHHSRLCFRQEHQPRILKQRAKHPIKVHIWGGIFKRGATHVIIFSDIMNAESSLRDHYPDGNTCCC